MGELEDLRVRVAELERELAEQAARLNAQIAATQERLYWLDRWGIDLDDLMRRRWMQVVFRVARAGRRSLRRLR